MDEIMKLIIDALADSDDVNDYDIIDRRAGDVGVELIDGRKFFIKVEPA